MIKSKATATKKLPTTTTTTTTTTIISNHMAVTRGAMEAMNNKIIATINNAHIHGRKRDKKQQTLLLQNNFIRPL